LNFVILASSGYLGKRKKKKIRLKEPSVLDIKKVQRTTKFHERTGKDPTSF
jgi:hypothetical protein